MQPEAHARGSAWTPLADATIGGTIAGTLVAVQGPSRTLPLTAGSPCPRAARGYCLGPRFLLDPVFGGPGWRENAGRAAPGTA